MWSSKKQEIIYRSSTEAKYRALVDTTIELILIQSRLLELHYILSSPPTIWSDNLSIISLTTNTVCLAHTKHVELDLHFVCGKVLTYKLLVQHIPSTKQPVDVLTKPLSITQFLPLRPKLSFFILPLNFGRILSILREAQV